MTLTIEIEEDMEATFRREAEGLGLSIEEYGEFKIKGFFVRDGRPGVPVPVGRADWEIEDLKRIEEEADLEYLRRCGML